jgi:hypothetical protein
LKKKQVCASFVPHLLTPEQRPASSVEYIEMTDDDTNVLKWIETGDEIWCFIIIFKHPIALFYLQ